MTDYRVVVRHVRYWRGKLHRWSNSFSYVGSWSGSPADLDGLRDLVSDVCYEGSDPNGGIFAVELYDKTHGGTAIASRTYFDWETPASWIPYVSAAYGGAGGFEAHSQAEVALLAEFAGGLSKTGKPVTFRKWMHAVPDFRPAPGAPDIGSATITSLQNYFNQMKGVFGAQGLTMGVGGRFAGNCTVSAYYGNHQMPRGRRRKVLSKTEQSALQNYLNGVIAQQAGKAAGS